ncbi:hypothetical protein [Flavobacterium microcysteis]|uniref:Uncharacterized protein n=1 Tax=Flavobacterium microcysteis TaxID=2596891 RepID=A0A501Q063_9FLAO|nr:hypothetical protein [Flavobacterium microcysteis]TPD65381.1 hypothetical protein FJA49_14375 [Flavobacterium microcysteis]
MLKNTLITGMAFLMLSCGNEKKEENNTDTESVNVVEGVKNLSKMSDAASTLEEQTAKLKEMTPLTNDELKAVVPETLGGLKRKSYSAGAMGTVGLSAIDAEYGLESDDTTKRINIGIMDGAGESGSAIVSLLAMGLSMDTESESNGTKSKTTEINGIRAMTEETKIDQTVRSSIKYIVKDRYSINLSGEGYSLAELEVFMKNINTSSLK